MLNTKLLGSVSAGPSEFIDDVFSTYLYTGNATARSITNGIDLAGEGGLVWTKSRSLSGSDHYLVDTARGNTRFLNTNSVAAQTNTSDITAFNNDGYSLNADVNGGWNNNGATFCSWTFRKAPKFFDVVTYTGNGSNPRNISHSLGAVPGMMIVKSSSTASQWFVYHRSIGNTGGVLLNQTLATQTSANYWGNTTPTSTQFTIGSSMNTAGETYVAYLFAHNAGGFGAAGTDNVISCGSYTGNGSTTGPVVTLGYEPQYVLIKRTDSSTNANWYIYDVMRGMPVSGSTQTLYANESFSEDATSVPAVTPTATGFQLTTTATGQNASGGTYIYMAIRRPMKPPTSGTQVFAPITYTGTNSAGQVISGAGFSPDLSIPKYRAGTGGGAVAQFIDRLRGGTAYLAPSSTGAEGNTAGYYIRSFDMDGVTYGTGYVDYTNSANTYVNWMFRRATGFFDVVCYTGTGSAVTFNHNLGVAPELLIFKRRDAAASWRVQSSALTSVTDSVLLLNATSAEDSSTANFYTTPTSTTFGFGTGAPTSTGINASGSTYVAYLFATLAGVSKVGSYTGNGSSQTINCGFTAGARFVMVKRTDSTGDWVVLDTARGIVSGNDPFLQLNSTAAEVTGEDIVDPANSGFIVNETTEAINTNAATYIYLAIA